MVVRRVRVSGPQRGGGSTEGISRREFIRRGMAVAVVASGVPALAACGGGIATQGNRQDTGGGDGGGPVKLGAPYPLSGDWAEQGQNCLNGMRLAVEEINAAGGIGALNGRQLEIVSVDTGSTDPNRAQSVTDRLCADEQVSAVVGCFLSALSLTASTATERREVPMVTQSLIDDLVERGYRYVFKLPPNTSSTGTEAVNYYLEIAEAQGRTVERAAIVGSNDAATAAQSETLRDQARERGIEVGAFVSFPPGLEDASAIVNQVSNAEPDVVFAGGPVADIALLVRNLRARGIEAPVVGSGGTGFLTQGLADALGDQVNGIMSISAWNGDMELEGAAEADRAWREEYDQPFMPNEAGTSYVAVYLFKEALERAGSSEPQALRDALAQIEVTSGPAAAYPPGGIRFDDAGMNERAEPIMIQWQDGVPKTVWPEDLAAVEVRA
jgi:branched-chain amino acid transport system substrate-binding protein